MTSVPSRPSQPLPRWFLTPENSQLHDCLRAGHRLAEFEPAILQQIEADLDAHGRTKKLLREADHQFWAERTPTYPTYPACRCWHARLLRPARS